MVADGTDPHGHRFEDSRAVVRRDPAPAARPAGTRRTPLRVSEVIFTSGTEAVPKAVMHTEQTANFSVRVARADLAMGPRRGVDAVADRPFHRFNYGVRFALYHGLPLVLQDRWDAAVAFDSCPAGAPPTPWRPRPSSRTWWPRPSAGRRAARVDDPLRLRRVAGPAGAGAPAAGSGIGVLRLYGSTEALGVTWNRPGSPGQRSRPTGPRSATSRSTCETPAVRCGARDEPGEILMRGPNTCVGFFADPERTAATFTPEAGFGPATS